MGDNMPDFTGIAALLGLGGLCVHVCMCTCVCTGLLRKWICAHHSASTSIFFVYLCMCVFLVCVCR